MSGQKPTFVTGANAKIKIGGKTVAYAQDVSYNVTVSTIPIETMGRYEVVSNEPIAYFVDGTLSVVRYTSIANGNGMPGTDSKGNSMENFSIATQIGNTAGTGSTAGAHFDPGKLLTSTSFDLEIFQKYDDGKTGSSQSVIKIKDCRFTRRGGALTKRGILVEQFAFNAIRLDDDKLITSGSGDTDLTA